MAEYNGKKGIWRTVGGRRIFIAEGEDLATAMKNSGKFKDLKKKKETFDENKDKEDGEYEEYKKMRLEDPSNYNDNDFERFNELDKKYLERFSKEQTRVVRYGDEYAVIQNGGIQGTFKTIEEAKEFERTKTQDK